MNAALSLHDAMAGACAAIGINIPRDAGPGRWAKSAVVGKSAKNGSGRVWVFPDMRGGVAYNWATGQQQIFRADAPAGATMCRQTARAQKRREEADRAEAARISDCIVRSCQLAEHPYLARKGFPGELGLVHENPRVQIPDTPLGRRIAAAIPEHDAPLLIVPGRVGGRVVTVQFIDAEGAKKNILGGQMGGAAHRIATGRSVWVCEGIATALSVRAALRLLGVSATVLSAFSAGNVAKVAGSIPGAFIAADNDRPIEALGNVGTGEFYAAQSGCRWTMPQNVGDFNDMHQSSGIRAVALHLRDVIGTRAP